MPGARNRRGPVERVEVNGTADADKEKEEKMEFRKFVREMRFSKGRTVEMRLAILASIVIGLRVFMSDLVSASDVAYNIFLFLLCETFQYFFPFLNLIRMYTVCFFSACFGSCPVNMA